MEWVGKCANEGAKAKKAPLPLVEWGVGQGEYGHPSPSFSLLLCVHVPFLGTLPFLSLCHELFYFGWDQSHWSYISHVGINPTQPIHSSTSIHMNLFFSCSGSKKTSSGWVFVVQQLCSVMFGFVLFLYCSIRLWPIHTMFPFVNTAVEGREGGREGQKERKQERKK